MITREQYLQLIAKASIDDQEKYYLTEIIRQVDQIEDLPSDVLLRIEDIFNEEVHRLQTEEDALHKELLEDEAAYNEKKSQLPAVLSEIDEKLLKDLDDLSLHAFQQMDSIDREEQQGAESQKKALDAQRYKEILEKIKKKPL